MTNRVFYLDTETTGIGAAANAIVEIAIVDEDGSVVVDTLINPKRPIPRGATAIHGIDDHMVESAPTLRMIWPDIRQRISGGHIVIYNAAFDRAFLPGGLDCAAKISCAMLTFSKIYGERDPYGRGNKWQKLEVAARHVGHRWSGNAHRALADALACRSVWQWIQSRG